MSPLEDPDTALRSIAETVARVSPGPASAWFAAGVSEYLAGEINLETALGLRGPGCLGTRAARRALAQRNELLREAFAMVVGPTPWARYQTLADRIRALPRIRTPGPFERLLLEAARYRPLPTTAEGLQRTLRD